MTVDQLTVKTALKLEKLKEKWSGFTRGIILAIAEEEMRISREEISTGKSKLGGLRISKLRDRGTLFSERASLP